MAGTILAQMQMVPVASETTTAASKVASVDGDRHRSTSVHVSYVQDAAATLQQRPIVSQSLGPRKGNLLKNGLFAAEKSCDPSSSDPDIGILSCGIGYECLVDEASSKTLGGTCTLTSRELQESSNACDICGDGLTVGKEFYGVALDIPYPEFQGITCGDLKVASYINQTIEPSTCSTVGDAAQAGGCCTPTCDLCGPGSYVSPSIFDLAVDIPLDGFEDQTCGGLFLNAYVSGTIDVDLCPAVGPIAQDAGCCVELPPSFYCDFCGNWTLLSEAKFEAEGGFSYTCGEMPFLFNETLCAQITDLVVPTCCGDPEIPTTAPQDGQPAAPSTSPPTSDATTIAPPTTSNMMTTTTLSIMCLTAATVASIMTLH